MVECSHELSREAKPWEWNKCSMAKKERCQCLQSATDSGAVFGQILKRQFWNVAMPKLVFDGISIAIAKIQ